MYKLSVVTPFHNVDMGMFEKCAESMRSQTIGFENIEWIIVVHNCEPHYLPLLTEMFKNDHNVIIKELNDGLHTPASPRNHGMQFVTTLIWVSLTGTTAIPQTVWRWREER